MILITGCNWEWMRSREGKKDSVSRLFDRMFTKVFTGDCLSRKDQ